MTYLSPLWARLSILPAIVFLLLGGLGMVIAGIKFVLDSDSAGMISAVCGGLSIYLGVVGFDLFKYRNAKAEIRDGALFTQFNDESDVARHEIGELSIKDRRIMQMAYLFKEDKGEPILVIDYKYPYAIELFENIMLIQYSAEGEAEP